MESYFFIFVFCSTIFAIFIYSVVGFRDLLSMTENREVEIAKYWKAFFFGCIGTTIFISLFFIFDENVKIENLQPLPYVKIVVAILFFGHLAGMMKIFPEFN